MKIVRHYFSVNAEKGFSMAQAMRLLPSKLLHKIVRLIKKERPGNVIDGFAKYNAPLLASYSRSGTNWLRYFIETISNRPTPGQLRSVFGTDYIVDRAHRAYPVMHKYQKVILVVRDYKECMLRNYKDHWLACKNVEQFLEDSSVEQPCIWYIKNLKAFNDFQGEKLLIYFEDLMTSPEIELVRIGEFLGLPETSVGEFLVNLEEHFERSVSAYTAGGHSSESTPTKNVKAHAEALLTEVQRHEFDDYFMDNYTNLARTYLIRYHYNFTAKACRDGAAH